MHLSITDQIIVVLYLAVIMSIGFAMKRRAAKGMSSYFLGGRQLPWWALALPGRRPRRTWRVLAGVWS